MDLRHRPAGGDVLHRDRRRGINLTRAIASLAQFIGQRHREAAGVSGRNQLGRTRAAPRDVPAKGVGFSPQDGTRCGNDPSAAVVPAPPDG